MATYNGKLVSWAWYEVFSGAAREGHHPQINDGQRTVAIQEQRIKAHGHYNAVTNPHGAAPALPGSPHIKYGRPNHAVDIQQPDGGFLDWLHRKGINAVRNVSTEAWHYDPVDLNQFVHVADKMRKHRQRLERYRSKAGKLSDSIHKRQKAGKSSPGQRLLLKRYDHMIAKLRGKAF